MTKTACCSTLLLLLTGLTCLGQVESWTRHDTLIPPEPRWHPTAGLKYDSIVGLTGTLGMQVEIIDPSGDEVDDDYWIAQLEAGEGGGKLQFGLGRGRFTGGAAKLSVLHTWNNPRRDIQRDETYVGAEVQFSISLLNGSVGFYVNVHGDDEHDTLVTWSAGVGF